MTADQKYVKSVQHAPQSLIPSDWFRAERTKILTTSLSLEETVKEREHNEGSCVVYWMQRDMRTVDNWALLWSMHLAQEHFKLPLHVIYTLQPPPPHPDPTSSNHENHRLPPALIDLPMSERHASFLLGGLELVHEELREKNIPMHIITPSVHEQVGQETYTFLQTIGAQFVVVDFTPIRHYRQWNEWQIKPLLEKAKIPLVQVDAHNLVPVWTASDKRQVGARTLRPRIHKQIAHFTEDFPDLPTQSSEVFPNATKIPAPAFERPKYETYFQLDTSVPPVEGYQPGTRAGMKKYELFVQQGLKRFDELRNDPTEKQVISGLSPWINHGHISFQRLFMEVKKLNKYANGTAAFVEEGVVRRELSDNFLYYSPEDYDTLETAAGWAQETLRMHEQDPREYVYGTDELEKGETHDDLWNAAQLQLVREAKMHGFLRMYWAKKILEWTNSPLVALRTAQYFNDKYALDGKDPNGFTGVGWSIMGIHDQGWKEREVFGKIRFMNYNGCKRKFKVQTFVASYKGASENAVKAARKPVTKKQKLST